MEGKGRPSSFLPKMPMGLGFRGARSHQGRKCLQEDVSSDFGRSQALMSRVFEGRSKFTSMQSQEELWESVESKLGLGVYGTW